MLGTLSTRIGGAAAVVAVSVALLLSCASPPSGESDAVLSDVSVERSDGDTVVGLMGLSGAVFTAFRGDQPDRVVVDLPGVRPEGLDASLPVYDGLVEEVSVAEFDDAGGSPSTRVEVMLAAAADYRVVTGDDRLEIRVTPASQASAIESETLWEAAEAEAWDETETAAVAEPSMEIAPLAEEAPAPAAPATRLIAVDPEGSASGSVVRLQADGQLEGVQSFTLEDPARLVIDLPALASDVSDNLMLVGSPHVQRIRVGAHPDKVRVVIDAGSRTDAFDDRHLVPMADGLLVALGTGELVERAVAGVAPPSSETAPMLADASIEDMAHPMDAMEPAEEMPASMDASSEAWTSASEPSSVPATSLVQAVDYAATGTADSIVVQTDQPVEYRTASPDAETFMLLLPGAALAPDASKRFAPEPGGPVALVSAFEQPDLATPEVRVVVTRASGLQPTVTQEGRSIVMSFDRLDSIAATPPALLPEAPVDMATETASAKAVASAAASLESIDEAPAMIAAVAETPAALEPEAPVEVLEEGGLLDGKEYVGRRISLDFKDVDIRDVLRLIADVSDLNIIAGDEVAGNVTIRLIDTPWDQALDVILLTKGLGFVRVGTVLRIAPAEILKQEEEARLQERRAKEKLEDLVVKLQPVNYANVKEVSLLTKRLLTPRGSVDIDERTNTVIIKDIPSVIDEATALIKAIDTQTPQVMIEARIVEAGLDFSREIGLEWGGGSQPDEDFDDFTTGGVKPITALDNRFPYNHANNVVVSNPISMTPTGLMNLGSFLLDDRININMRLQAAEVNGEGKVISSPRVVTLDNREALIEQGVSIPFQTFENGDAQLEFIDAVLSLKVTPHITADRSIIMTIEVSRNAPDSSVETPTGSPAIAKNQAKTETLVKDGQTLVLGGIYVIDKAETESRVPYFWKIPVLGYAFKNRGIRDQRKELLIFVTPTVVEGRPEAI